MSSFLSSDIAPSSSASNIQPIELPFNFWDIMKRDHPDMGRTGQKRKSSGSQQFSCIVCSGSWPPTASKSNAVNHCRRVHPVTLLQQRFNDLETPLSQAFLPSAASLQRTFDRNAYKEALIALITRRRLPFSSVEWPEMQALLLAANPECSDKLIKSRRSVVRLMAANYVMYRDQLQDTLTMARSPIHLQADIWTSPHRKGMLAICGQWINHEYKLQKALLGLVELPGDHSGSSQAALIHQVLKQFDITSNLGWFTGDNATSNDTCLESLASRLLEEHQVSFPPFLDISLILYRLNTILNYVVYAVSPMLLIYLFKPSFLRLPKKLLWLRWKQQLMLMERNFLIGFP
jgi:hypothetical protein